jgi:hypothetical protein
MNPFEFVIAILVIIFGYKLIAGGRLRRHRMFDEQADTAAVEAKKRLDELEERVRVLERIVTDERYDLKRQFRELES